MILFMLVQNIPYENLTFTDILCKLLAVVINPPLKQAGVFS